MEDYLSTNKYLQDMQTNELLMECQEQLELLMVFIKENGGIKKVLEQFEMIRLNSYLNKDIFSIREAADYLDISKNHLYRLTATQEFPTYRPGGKILYIKRSDLDTWICRNRYRSKKEIEKEAEERIVLLNRERQKRSLSRNLKKHGK